MSSNDDDVNMTSTKIEVYCAEDNDYSEWTATWGVQVKVLIPESEFASEQVEISGTRDQVDAFMRWFMSDAPEVS